jgi:single-stranded DNA-binding protein
MLPSLATGTRVLVTGVPRKREWINTDGDQRYAYEVDVTEVDASIACVTAKITKTTRDSANQ